MANLASAKKRIRQDARKRVRNRAHKATVKTETRRFLDAIQQGDVEGGRKLLSAVTRKLDQVSAKGVLHKNTVSRRKSRLAARLNALIAAG